MWWKTLEGNYVNGVHIAKLFVRQDTSPAGWLIDAYEAGGPNQTLNGVYSTQAEAQEAARRLVHGYDPAS